MQALAHLLDKFLLHRVLRSLKARVPSPLAGHQLRGVRIHHPLKVLGPNRQFTPPYHKVADILCLNLPENLLAVHRLRAMRIPRRLTPLARSQLTLY